MPAGEAPSARAALQGPLGQSVVGPYAGKKSLAFGTGNTFNVGEGQEVRLVDAAGNVIFSGSGVEGANRAVAAAQSLSDELGGNANFKIQTGERTINPDGSVGPTRYIDVARAAPSQSGLGFLADYVLPFAASFIPVIGPVAGAALGSAASSAAQGRGLEDALKRAAIAAGSAYLGGQVFGPASPGASAPTGGVNADLVPNALKGLNFGSLPSASIPAGVGSTLGATAGDIIVKAAPSLLGSTVGSVVGSTVPSLISAPAPAPMDQPAPTEQSAPTQPEEIVVTGNIPQATAAPLPIPGFETAIPAITGGALTAAQTAGTPPSENKFKFNDVLGTGLSVPQLLSIGSVGADLLQNLLAGGDGAGAGVSYVSPFGTGVGIGAGRDMRATPNITDYERYGFGPEAMFFQPGYGLLSTGAAPTQAQPIMTAPQAQPAMVTNPRYEPLI